MFLSNNLFQNFPNLGQILATWNLFLHNLGLAFKKKNPLRWSTLTLQSAKGSFIDLHLPAANMESKNKALNSTGQVCKTSLMEADQNVGLIHSYCAREEKALPSDTLYPR